MQIGTLAELPAKGNHSREALPMFGKAPASPAPNRKRITTRLARFQAAPVNADRNIGRASREREPFAGSSANVRKSAGFSGAEQKADHHQAGQIPSRPCECRSEHWQSFPRKGTIRGKLCQCSEKRRLLRRRTESGSPPGWPDSKPPL